MKEKIELIEINEDILVAGINLQNSGLPITFDSLGVLWSKFAEENRRKVLNMKSPYVEYSISYNRIPDYITGCEVNEEVEIENVKTYIIPKGKYIKNQFVDEKFDLLTNQIYKRMKESEKWAKDNNLKINKEFSVESYPIDDIDNNQIYMYLLTPLK